MWLRKERPWQPSPVDAVGGLRMRSLRSSSAALGIGLPEQLPRVWGAIMEIGFPDGAATLVCFADGSTSLLFSSGRGMTDSGEQPPVREAADAFLNAADSALAAFVPAIVSPLPLPGRVRFYLRTTDGLAAQ